MELSQYMFEPLREDEEFLLYEGRPRPSEAAPVLLLAPVSTRPELESLKKIEHEYSLRSALDSAWAVRPLELSERWIPLAGHGDDAVFMLRSRSRHGSQRVAQKEADSQGM